MRSKKKYSNVNFTKRVDHESGHVAKQPPTEPGLCKSCGAVYVRKHWTKEAEVIAGIDLSQAGKIKCPACSKAEAGIPAGFVYMDHEFLGGFPADIRNLIQNEEKKISATNPLARVMKLEKTADGLVVTTTTEHFAQHLGRALNSAFSGKVRYDFSHENKLARVYLTAKPKAAD